MKLHFLIEALLLVHFASCRNIAIEDEKSGCECTDSSDESGLLTMDCKWLSLTSVPSINCDDSVQIMDLSYNPLHLLHNVSFRPFPNLKQLTLSSDNIMKIEFNTFNNLKTLRKLDLSYNKLNFIHPNMLTHNKKLETLSLQGNPLEPASPLLVSSSLRSLDLSHCHLTQLRTDIFSDFPQLKSLDLSHNNLQQLTLNSMPSLASLWLAGNYWQCDCHLHELLKWVSHNKVKLDPEFGTHNEVQCWQGEELKNVTTQHDFCAEATVLSNSGYVTDSEAPSLNHVETCKTCNKNSISDDNSSDSFMTADTILAFFILASILAVAVCVSILAVNYVTSRFLKNTSPVSSTRQTGGQPLLQSATSLYNYDDYCYAHRIQQIK